jgi:hypothetical protein
MKKATLITLILLGAALVTVGSGATAAPQNVDWRLTGTAEWSGSGVLTETFAINGAIEGVGTYSGTLNAGAYYTTDTCGPQCAPVTGTITFDTRRGSITTNVDPAGLVTVTTIGSGTTYGFSLTLVTVSGTRAYRHVTGTLDLSYASHLPTNQPDCSVCPIEDVGTVTGTLTHVLAPSIFHGDEGRAVAPGG